MTFDRFLIMTARLMRHTEGQKSLLSSLKQNFAPEVSESEEAFANFEKTFEGLVTADNENKKSVLDQVCFNILHMSPRSL